MYDFRNDYTEGAHPAILQKLVETNDLEQAGYNEDDYSIQAKEILRMRMSAPEAAIYFVAGGTQANLIVISALLRPHEAVISAKTGHVFANEAGAIESTGHKVIAVDTSDGKLTPDDIKQVLDAHKMRPHVVKPAMVYISNATETGTFYKKIELRLVSELCRRENLLLFMDGARLGYALTAADSDLSLTDIAALTDAFYIGGTKNGALLGEAIVLPTPASDPGLDYIIKQKGALMAKSRVLGIQFYELFKDDLYFRLASHGNIAAKRMSTVIRQCGFGFLAEPCTNQLFPILPNAIIEELSKNYLFYIWKNIDPDHSAIRMITSWATSAEKVNRFIIDLKAICEKNQYLNREEKLQ